MPPLIRPADPLASALGSGGGKLRFALDFSRKRTFSRHRSDLHPNAVWQTGAFSGDGQRFVHRGDVEKEIPADRLLGFSERSIGDDAVLARNDFPLAFERTSSDCFALFGHASEPGHPLLGDSLHLLGRKTFAQLGTAK